MAYKPQAKNYRLLGFADYPGMEVTLSACTVGEINHLSDMDPSKLSNVQLDTDERLELFHFIAGKLVGWNLVHPEVPGNGACLACGTKEDEPMETDVSSLLCLELDMIVRITYAWMQAMVRLPKEMSGNSSNGAPNIPVTPELTEEITQKLASLQNPVPLPKPNFS